MSLWRTLFGKPKKSTTTYPMWTPAAGTAGQMGAANLANWGANATLGGNPMADPLAALNQSYQSWLANAQGANSSAQMSDVWNRLMETAGPLAGAHNMVPQYANAVTAQTPQSALQKMLQEVPGLQPAGYAPSGMMGKATEGIIGRMQTGAGLAGTIPKLIEQYAKLGESQGRKEALALAHRFAGRGSNVGALIAQNLSDSANRRQLELGQLLASLMAQDEAAKAGATGQALSAEQLQASLGRIPQQDMLERMILASNLSGQDFTQQLQSRAQELEAGLGRANTMISGANAAANQYGQAYGQAAQIPQLMANLRQIPWQNALQMFGAQKQAATTESGLQGQQIAQLLQALSAPWKVQTKTQTGATPGLINELGELAKIAMPFLVPGAGVA